MEIVIICLIDTISEAGNSYAVVNERKQTDLQTDNDT